MKTSALPLLCFFLASCATGPQDRPADPYSNSAAHTSASPSTLPVQSSPACLAAKLPPGAPLAAGTIPDEILRGRQSGSVAVRYDVIAGKAQNLAVVSSNPVGLYDAYVLKHAARYCDGRGTTVRGCVMTIDIKF